MAENSGISWCDATFNPWMGCAKVSPACKFCYAERDMDHRYGRVKWCPTGNRVLTSDANWKKPIKWNRMASGEYPHGWADGKRPRVFCASLADVFDDWDGPIHDHNGNRLAVWPDGSIVKGEITNEYLPHIPGGAKSHWMTMNDVRKRLFNLIDATPNLDWLLLTKRPENILKIWQNKDHLMGESGPKARPSHPDWFRSIRDQCHASGVPFHFKQWGEWVVGDHDCVTFADKEVLPWHDKEGSDITPMCRVGVKRAGRMLDGVLHDAFPEVRS
jgi:protein gp37